MDPECIHPGSSPSLGPAWIGLGSSLDLGWIWPGSNLDPAWIKLDTSCIQPGSNSDPRWTKPGSSLDPAWIKIGSSFDPDWIQPGSAACYAPMSEISIWRASAPYSYMLLHQLFVLYFYILYTHDMSLDLFRPNLELEV